MKKKLYAILFSSLGGFTFSSMAAASVTFSDSTFNLSDYSISKYQFGGADATVSQTSFGNPGAALQIETHSPGIILNHNYATQYLINNNFRYDPTVQGVINTISASEDIVGQFFQTGSSYPYNPIGSGRGGLILIEQAGNIYTNVRGNVAPPISGTYDFNSVHANGLKATDFGLVTDFTTFQVDERQHPNFSNGVLEFGFPGGPHATDFYGLPETITVVRIDNFSLTVSSVPEPETYAMLLAGLGLIGFLRRRKNWL
jgi:hypothetical protein